MGGPPLVNMNNGTDSESILILNAIAWSPDLEHCGNSSQSTAKDRSPNANMTTLQPKGSVISRSSFAALDVEEPESEEELEVVELPPAQ